jgi:hypothetical protein
MVQFALNQTIETREPTIVVDPGLALGRHGFQLEVFDAAGNRSRPDVAVVEVQRETVTPPPDRLVGPARPPVGPRVGPLDAPNPPIEPSPSATVPRAERAPKSRKPRSKKPRRPRNKE